MVWADKARVCVEWGEEDGARLAELRAWLESGLEEIVDELAEKLVKSNGVQPMMRNARFTQRLREVLHEWLTGVVKGPFHDGLGERRRQLGQKLADVSLTFEDVILLEGMARERLLALAQTQVADGDGDLSATIAALNKAMTYDRGLVYAGCRDLHDAELESALLDRFLTVTGFSPTLYESLVDAWQWNQRRTGDGQA